MGAAQAVGAVYSRPFRQEEWRRANTRLAKSHASLASTLSHFENVVSAAINSKDEEGWGSDEQMVEGFGEVMRAGLEWAYALEAKNEGERLVIGAAVAGVSNDRMVKSAVCVCECLVMCMLMSISMCMCMFMFKFISISISCTW